MNPLLIFCASFLFLFAQQQTIPKNDHPQKPEATKSQQRIEPDCSVLVKCEPPTQSHQPQAKENKYDSPHWLYILYLLSGPVYALLAVGTGIVVWKQVIAIRRIERPWLFVTHIRPENILNPDRSNEFITSVRFTVKNYGKSPAWIVSMGGTFDTISSDAELPKRPSYGHIVDETGRNLVVLPFEVQDDPWSYDIPHVSGRPMNHDEFEKGVKQQTLWVVYGFIKYRDMFDKTHETRFCSFLTRRRAFTAANAGKKYTRHT